MGKQLEKPNRKVESFYYRHHLGMFLDNKNGMMQYTLKNGIESVAVYSFTLEHLTQHNNRSTVSQTVEFLDSQMIFDNVDTTKYLESCPDLENDAGTIKSLYLEKHLVRKISAQIQGGIDGAKGNLVQQLENWINREEWEKITRNTNTYFNEQLITESEAKKLQSLEVAPIEQLGLNDKVAKLYNSILNK